MQDFISKHIHYTGLSQILFNLWNMLNPWTEKYIEKREVTTAKFHKIEHEGFTVISMAKEIRK